jgi:Domain of unknown function (DUF4124)
MTERRAALALTAALLLAPLPGAAQVHRWVSPQGVVSYSDRPQPSSPVTAPEPQPQREALPPRETVSLAPVAVPPATLGELLEASGLRVQLAGLTLRLAAELRPPEGRVSSHDLATIQRVVATTLAADRVYRLVHDEAARNADTTTLRAQAAWLATRLGRKVAALERRDTGVEADARVAAFTKSLAANPPSPRRRELIERLDWVSGASGVSLEIVAALSGSIARAGAAAAPPALRTPAHHIERHVTEVRARAAESVRESTLAAMLYTYRDLSDDELAQYVTVESSDLGRRYNRLMRRALVRVLERVLEETAVAMFKAVPPERWAQAASPAARPTAEAVAAARVRR